MYTLEQLPGEPIIIMTYKEPFDWQTEIPEASVEFVRMLEEQPGPVYFIHDFGFVGATVADAIFTTNYVTRISKVLHHPKMKEFLATRASGLVALAAKGMDSDIFGNVPVKAFDTVEEALEYARMNIQANL